MLGHISGMLLVMGLTSTFQGAVGINVGTNLTNVNLKLQPSRAVPWTTARRNSQAVESAQSPSPHMHTYSPTPPLRDSFLRVSAMCPTYDNSILTRLPPTTPRRLPRPALITIYCAERLELKHMYHIASFPSVRLSPRLPTCHPRFNRASDFSSVIGFVPHTDSN